MFLFIFVFLILGDTKTHTFQMMAAHGKPCDETEATFCMNGGTCYKIPSMDTLSCVCNDNFKGSRCEHFTLQSSSPDPNEAGLIAAVVIVVILIIAVLVAVIYQVYRMKTRNQNQQNNPPEYWKVKSNYDPSSR
ncbi:pro-neuregulin-4, membrane-bound isoform-like isoform X1 [Melanotaenia boesemani]|uniref:pro-neuregulin-4, membrane-bound isoform-like isoform X1 n=2 Tax=Melanotaenia boesemani TaxID=1250792 RepID=UPI001C042226|nr:pro-neuregulin-4, membrane-bound isoform-like isoform X1 [Melanotaenia boesemani]